MAAEILEIWIWTGSVSSGYIFYVLVTIVSFFLIVETREGMLVCLKKSASFVLFGFSFSVFFSFPWISKGWSSSYSSHIRLPNCLPTFPKMAQLSANIAQLFAINVIHRPTVWQLCRRPTNCLPSSCNCHSDHQIKSIRFLFGFLFFPSVIVWFCVFYFFTGFQLAALYIWMMAAEILEIWIWMVTFLF